MVVKMSSPGRSLTLHGFILPCSPDKTGPPPR